MAQVLQSRQPDSGLGEQPPEFPLHYSLPEGRAAFVHEDQLSRRAAVPFPGILLLLLQYLDHLLNTEPLLPHPKSSSRSGQIWSKTNIYCNWLRIPGAHHESLTEIPRHCLADL